MKVEPVPRGEWSPLPRPGCTDVDGKVLLSTAELLIAMLRFGSSGTIDEHSAAHEIDVICLEGRGNTSIENESHSLSAGERVRWPAGKLHRLWTDGETMVTLMVEHYEDRGP